MDIYWITGYDPVSGEVITAGGRYATLENPNFAPQTDLTGTSMPVNEYTVDVITTDDIPVEVTTCELYDDRNQLWAAFPIRKVVRISEHCLRLTCTSWTYQLQYHEMAETVYTGETAATIVAAIFAPDANAYQMQSALQSVQIYGYAPAQTARDRLTWLLLVLGAHVKDTFTDRVWIKATDETETLVPLEHTYWRPSLDKVDWVTGIKVTAYTFSQAASQAEWEANDNSYMFPLPWIATEQVFEVSNPDAPEDAPANVKEITGVYFVTPSNASAIIANLAKYWFNPVTASADIINNRDYGVGDLIDIYTGESSMIKGYVKQLSFQFGHQAKSTVSLIGCEEITTDALTVNYICDNKRIGRAKYYLPVGMSFSIENKYLDQTRDGHRRVYRPTTATVTGTMVSGGVTVNVTYEMYLDLFEGVLHVIGVDEITEQSSGGITIGVIA